MASYHLSVGVGKKGSGGSHAAYVSRSGEYENFKGTEELVLSEHGNMPSWAEHDPTEFFRQADLHERKNGSAYREYEIAIPNEFTKDQQIEFVREFIRQEIGTDHPYLYGIHNHRATIDGEMEQPHAHIMFSDRKLDGIERNPEAFFKRYNAKNPEQGGCQKANFAATGETAAERRAERKENLVALRERFASLQNAHLEKHGHHAAVTHLSLKDQGIDRPPERHLGPVDSRDAALVRTLKEFRLASIMLNVEKAMVKTIDLTSSITAAIAERKQHERASRDKHPSRSQAPTGLDSLRTVWGSDNIHHQKLPQMLLQQDAPAHVRQPGGEEPAHPDLHQRDTVAERSVEQAAQAAAAEPTLEALRAAHGGAKMASECGARLCLGNIVAATSQYVVQHRGRDEYVVHRRADLVKDLSYRDGNGQAEKQDALVPGNLLRMDYSTGSLLAGGAVVTEKRAAFKQQEQAKAQKIERDNSPGMSR
jgi:hypothetical protein